MKAIFHLHTNYSYDALIKVPKLIDKLVAKGIQVLAITEHNNMDSYPIALEYIKQKQYPLILIPAEEIATQQGEVIGLFLKESIPRGLSLLETVNIIQGQGAVLHIPHPFDTVRKERIRDKNDLLKILPYIDSIEVFNARSLQGNKESEEFANTHSLLKLWGPDAHFNAEIFNCVVDIPEFEMNRESFLQALKQAKPIRMKRCFSGALKSGLLKRWKKLWKKR